MKKYLLPVGLVMLLASCGGDKWTETEMAGYNLITQKGGATLGYSPNSGVQILYSRGYAFKDLNKNGEIDVYEDWREDFKDRAADLAKQLSIEEIAGLMLYSAHQSIPNISNPYFGKATYNGKEYAESGAKPYELTDQQKTFLEEDNLRHVLIMSVESPAVAAQWNNKMQEFVEGLGHGIPCNTSSDPRHTPVASAEFDFGAGGDISLWPSEMGLAATFDPSVVEDFGRIASLEYRALGITTALSPQVDIATDPRWWRNNGTFSESPQLSADLARAYCDGFQNSSREKELSDGWGYESVNAMVKHWPGGGSGEGGRDAHYSMGKYAVYPGHNEGLALIPFVDGAFKLKGKTKKAAAVMPYYTISYGLDPSGQNVGNNFSKYIINDLLRDKYNYDGVVCTDWSVTADEKSINSLLSGKSHGVEHLSVAERHYQILMAGVDQFGGNNEKGPVLEAYEMGVKEHGEEFMRQRFEASARRLLMNIFRVGLFENPYLNPEESAAVVGCKEFMEAGYNAQLKSLVMLKNKNNALPVKDAKKKVYVPQVHQAPSVGIMGNAIHESYYDPVDKDMLAKYFEVVDSPEEADFAIVFISSPDSGNGYSVADARRGGNGYIPISLQYNDYKAVNAREHSIAGGDPLEKTTDRSYRGKITRTSNKSDLESILTTRTKMGDKPVIVVANANVPFVVAEFEPFVDAILIGFTVQNQAILDLISGKAEPSGLLPMQFPLNMATVEEQFEDTPRDMRCYVDSEGHTYDFAYGMNWKGVINDSRVKKYK